MTLEFAHFLVWNKHFRLFILQKSGMAVKDHFLLICSLQDSAWSVPMCKMVLPISYSFWEFECLPKVHRHYLVSTVGTGPSPQILWFLSFRSESLFSQCSVQITLTILYHWVYCWGETLGPGGYALSSVKQWRPYALDSWCVTCWRDMELGEVLIIYVSTLYYNIYFHFSSSLLQSLIEQQPIYTHILLENTMKLKNQ